MSKEQTLTAREFIPKNDNGLYSRRQVEKHAEEYAQAKVLEALERLKVEISKGENVYNHLEIVQLIEIVKEKK